jgi:hypothetical protein
MNGTWQTTGGGSAVGVGAGAVAAAAVVYVVVALIWFIVIGAFVLLVLGVAGAVWMHRRYPAYSPVIARQAADIRAAVAAVQAVEAKQGAVTVHYHGGTHLHIEPGADAHAILRQSGLLITEVSDYPPVDP